MKYKKYHLKRIFKEIKNIYKDSDSSSAEYDYLNIVQEAIDNESSFDTFRSDKRYQDILEHINEDLAKNYYFKLREELSHKEILNLCNSIQLIGSPLLIKFRDDLLNPTSLRYINVALDLKNKFSGNNFENFIELGAGFGGQALILNQFYKIKSYTFVDLPQVNELIKKFLNLHNPNFDFNFATIDTYERCDKYDLFLSNYAYSELPKRLQINVASKIIKDTKYGYMIVNNYNSYSIRYLSRRGYEKYLNNLCVFNEIPESYIFNKILTFKN
tara:strand:- start:31940 stop:32755 length:816 start_codon:yes stop_codon:yes gene_type:complete